jgi:pimeloyl-ACP methyl ester carboxylesterase
MLRTILDLLTFSFKADIPAEKLRKKYAHPESKYMQVDSMQVHYRDEGNKNDLVPLVLIHGTSSSLHTWDACTDVWKRTRRVIRFDLPGFGLTGPNPSKEYSLDYYAAFVIKMLDNLKVNSCYLAGNSWGGAITWYTAMRYPLRVKKMILLNSDINAPFKLGKGALGFKLAIKLGKNSFLRFIPRYLTPEITIQQSVNGVYHDKSKIKPSTYELYRDLTLREGNRDSLICRLTTPFTNYINEIKNINTPTLVIWGRYDAIVPVHIAEIFKNGLPNNKTVILENSGHIPMEENPEIVAPLIEDFIKEN